MSEPPVPPGLSGAKAATAPVPPQPSPPAPPPARPKEIGGPTGPEPTRYGDWERKGRCIDF